MESWDDGASTRRRCVSEPCGWVFEYATLVWVDWFNNRRLLEPIGYVPPAEFEAGTIEVNKPT